MRTGISRVAFEEVRSLRDGYRREMRCQIVRDSLPGRGLSDCYLIRVDGGVAGHGCVCGSGPEGMDLIQEFHLLPEHRRSAPALFRRFAAASRARAIEAQTNDPLLTLMLFDCASGIVRQKILFDDAFTTALTSPGGTCRRIGEGDRARVFVHEVEPVGDWMLEARGEVVATGGIMLHYNPPYADLFVEVAAPFRRRGYGSFLVQEMKRACREMGRTPAARCQASNEASRATLQKAGFLPCARILRGVIAP